MDKLHQEIAKKLFIVSNGSEKDYYGISPDPLKVAEHFLAGVFTSKGWVFKQHWTLDLSGLKIKYLPKFKEINTNLDISDNHIETLGDRLPKNKISGLLDISDNRLKSLAGCPNVVGAFSCGNNGLYNLKGSPQKVLGYYECGNNNLSNLRGIPDKIQGDLNCEHNELTNLESLPSIIKGHLFCFGNPLGHHYYIPDGVHVRGHVYYHIPESEKDALDQEAHYEEFEGW